MPTIAKIEITLDDAGNCSVSGSIDNKLLAYGLLEVARETIYLHHVNAAKRILEVPAGMRILSKDS